MRDEPCADNLRNPTLNADLLTLVQLFGLNCRRTTICLQICTNAGL